MTSSDTILQEKEQRLLETLAQLGIDADATPDRRIGGPNVERDQSQLRALMRQLRPLSVDRGDASEEAEIVVIGRLGEGGMGIVELATQRALGREVALKRLKPETTDEHHRLALLDEARIHGGLEHPNIVPVHAIGVDPDVGPIVVLKRVQGLVWTEALAADREELPGDAGLLEKHLRVLMQVCNALHFAHSRGVFHRDVKPANVMLGDFGEVYLLDWGLAIDAESRGGEPAVAGTAPYMAPEMLEGDLAAVDERTDVYLVGATLHEILTGRARNHGPSVIQCLARATLSQPVSFEDAVPAEIGSICNRACARDPEMRFKDAAELRDAIGDYLHRREAQMLVDAAEALLEHAEDDDEGPSRRLYEARFAAEQALRVRPGFGPARSTRKRCIEAAIRYELERDNARGARSLAIKLEGGLPEELRMLIEAKEGEISTEMDRVSALERDVDVELSRRQRLIFGATGATSVCSLVAAEYFLHPGDGVDMPASLVLAFGVAYLVPAVPVLLFVTKKLRETAVGRQFLSLVLATFCGMLVIRTIGFVADVSAPLIYANELAVISIVPLAVNIDLRGRTHIAIFGLLVAVLCAAYPEMSRHLHSSAFVLMTSVIVIDNAFPRRKPSS